MVARGGLRMVDPQKWADPYGLWRARRKSLTPPAQQLRKATANVRKLLPATEYERTVFVAVVLTAGLCEEFLYRRWLLNVIAAATGSLWIALVLSSIVFGVAHFYQGRSGMIGASVLGIVFGAVFVATGSLFPGQALHALMDLNNGLALGKVSSQFRWKLRRRSLSAFPLVDELQERRGFGITGAELQRLIKIGSRPRQVGLVQQMIDAHEQMRPRVERPHLHNTFSDFSGFIVHFELVIFRGEKIQPGVIARVGGDFFLQGLDVPVVLAAPRFTV